MKNGFKLFIALALPQIAGISGALFTETGAESWYQQINKPEWNPPGWLFGPVWTTLYILMGIAFYLVWNSKQPASLKKTAMMLWAAQLVFNFFWTVIFFQLHLIEWALAEMAVLWLLIFVTIVAFARINRLAAWLLVPYISWVSFAFLLNGSIYLLNR